MTRWRSRRSRSRAGRPERRNESGQDSRRPAPRLAPFAERLRQPAALAARFPRRASAAALGSSRRQDRFRPQGDRRIRGHQRCVWRHRRLVLRGPPRRAPWSIAHFSVWLSPLASSRASARPRALEAPKAINRARARRMRTAVTTRGPRHSPRPRATPRSGCRTANGTPGLPSRPTLRANTSFQRRSRAIPTTIRRPGILTT